jgi:serine protease
MAELRFDVLEFLKSILESPRRSPMKRSFLFLLSITILIPTFALALDTSTRKVSPVMTWGTGDLATFDAEWLHFKCVEGMNPQLMGDVLIDAGRDMVALNSILTVATDLRRTFPGSRDEFRDMKARGERAAKVTGPDLSLWYDMRVAGGPAVLASVINDLNALAEIEIAHPAPICEPAAIIGGALPLPAPDFSGQQDYLYATPVGLDAPAAWATPGGRGAAMKFIDVELGWVLGHEEFNPATHFYQGGAAMDPGYYDHGTAVMGEVVGMDNGSGITGFAEDAQWGVVAITESEWPNVPHYFQEAVDNLNAGDVWLIELQMYPSGFGATPMEWLQVNYDVIWTGCWAEGVVCIEAGANGSQNLDAPAWNGVFDRTLRDSGAIMVGAGTPTGRVAEYFTNYGSRMDAHAWGSSIVTTGYGDLYNGGNLQTEYTAQFGGTSGASPMVTGAALCLQGIAKSAYGNPLNPDALRTLINSTGIAHLDPSREIGPRPDLGAAVDALLSGTPVQDLPVAGGLRVLSAKSPFQHCTEIRFQQARSGEAKLTVFDTMGRRVRKIQSESASSGTQSIYWDGHNSAGRPLSSGIYLYRIEAGGETANGRLVMIR